MKTIPKRMRQALDGNVSRGMFLAEKAKYVKADFSPRYMIVANDIIKRIYDGEYRPGSKLPSMRMLAKRYGVSVQVILSAFQGLQALHYVESRPKSGIFVSADIEPALFYRVGLFILNHTPFIHCGILYDLVKGLDAAGYTVIPGMNFDGGLRLKQWVQHKRDLDALIIIGQPTVKDIDQFKRIGIPYTLVAAKPTPEVPYECRERANVFVKWFLATCIQGQVEDRPIYLFDKDAVDELKDGGVWEVYKPRVIYTPQPDGSVVRTSVDE